ncbi:MAG: P-loop NTPase [Phycisphaerae bacterium]|nr:P-loop NTPase [Phycisphaerae bacterium]
MTDRCPSSSPRQVDPERELENEILRGRMERIGQKLLVLSGKGGVGKSTVAANLAVALAAAGSHVGLLDVDIHGPSIPRLLGLEGRRPEVVQGLLEPVRVSERLAVISIDFFLPDERAPVIWRGPRKFGAIKQFLKDVNWGTLDYLVVDSPPGTGDEPLAVAELVGQPAQAVIVTTPQELAVADVRRCVSFCRSLSLSVAGVVENMSGFACPSCGHVVDLFKRGGGQRLAEETRVPFLGAIPIDPRVVIGGDAGAPVASGAQDSPAARAFATIVQTLLSLPARAADDRPAYSTEDCLMKIAIPVENGRLCTHFGHCAEFAVYDVAPGAKAARAKTVHRAPPHEPGVLPRWLHEQGANVIITGGMGQRAQQLFAENGIQVIMGAPPELADDVVAAYLAGTLQTGANPCDH